MKIALLTHGTRGDVQPMVVLAHRLREQGCRVRLVANARYEKLVASSGIEFLPIPIDLQGFLERPEAQRMLASGSFRALFEELARLDHENRIEFSERCWLAGDGADLIVSTSLTCDRAACLAEKLGIPYGVVFFYPLTRTGTMQSVFLRGPRIPTPWLRALSHDLVWSAYMRRNRRSIAEFRSRLGLRPRWKLTLRRVLDQGNVIHAWSPHLFPAPLDWPAHLHPVGAWHVPVALRSCFGERPPVELERWITAGDPPIFFGFGSMPIVDPSALIGVIERVTLELGIRAVVQLQRGHARAVQLDMPQVRVLFDDLDHSWLLSRCRAAVHHGGAGTTLASLYAGLPTLICSVWADQPWWGTRLSELGVGGHVPFSQLTEGSLSRGLQILLAEETRERAASVGVALQREGDCSEAAARRIRSWAPAPNTLQMS